VDPERERARRAAEAEAAALREMLHRPRKVLKAPEPEPAPKARKTPRPVMSRRSSRQPRFPLPGQTTADARSLPPSPMRHLPRPAATAGAPVARRARAARVAVVVAATPSPSARKFSPSSSSRVKSTCPRQFRLPILRTRCPSRPPRSSSI
jgi:translation initiation factor IF-2